MKKTGILLFVIPAVLMAMFFFTAFFGVVYLMISKDSEMRTEAGKRTAETVGTITDYSEDTDVTANSVSTYSKLSFKFIVSGESYSAHRQHACVKIKHRKAGQSLLRAGKPAKRLVFL